MSVGGCGHLLPFLFCHIRWILYNPPLKNFWDLLSLWMIWACAAIYYHFYQVDPKWIIFWDLLRLWMSGAGAATPGKWVVIKPVMALITRETREYICKEKKVKFLLNRIIMLGAVPSFCIFLEHLWKSLSWKLCQVETSGHQLAFSQSLKENNKACLRKRSFYLRFQRHCSFSALYFYNIAIL